MLVNNPQSSLRQGAKMEKMVQKHPVVSKVLVAFLALGIVIYGYQQQASFAYVKNYLQGKYDKMVLEPLPKMEIDIKFKDFAKISAIRNQLVEGNHYLSNVQHAKTWFPANITLNGKKYKAKLRLKGDMNVHRNDASKWSFKIKLKKGKTLWGMNIFAVQHPKTQSYGMCALANNMARQNGIISMKQLHVNVILNGENIGIMNLEESFAKELLESQQKKESVMVKVSEHYFWNYMQFMQHAGAYQTPKGVFEEFVNDYHKASLEPYYLKEKATTEATYKNVVALYRSVLAKQIPASHVFDAAAYAKLFALINILADETSHIFMQQNIRAYFNPISAKFEPIAYDWAFYETNREVSKGDYLWQELTDKYPIYSFGAHLLSDTEIFRHYVIESQKLATDILNGVYDDTIKQYAATHRYMMSEFADVVRVEKFNPKAVKDYLYMRAQWVKDNVTTLASQQAGYDKLVSTLNHQQSQVSTKHLDSLTHYQGPVLQAYNVQKDGADFLEIRNIMPKDIHITAITINPNSAKPALLKTVHYPIIIPASKGMSLPQSTFIPYHHPQANLRIDAGIASAGHQTHPHFAQPYALPNSASFIPKRSLEAQLHSNPFLTVQGNTIIVQAGQWQVNGNIIVPRGYQLNITKGTVLQFGEDNMIIAHGPVHFLGTAKAPIVLQGVNDQKWRGIAVLEAPEMSHLRHVRLRNVSGVKHGNWALTGAVSFYQSNVTMRHVAIDHNLSEDALNIIHSTFDIDGIAITNSYSDGFDCDFCHGTIRNSYFHTIGVSGGDAIDVSGSHITIDNVTMDTISDKALSVGEASVVTINNAHVQNALAAFVSKDGSRLQVGNSAAKNIKIACFMAYQKKPHYGAAGLTAKRTTCLQADQKSISQTGSNILLDGALQPSHKLDVDHLYQTFMKK